MDTPRTLKPAVVESGVANYEAHVAVGHSLRTQALAKATHSVVVHSSAYSRERSSNRCGAGDQSADATSSSRV